MARIPIRYDLDGLNRAVPIDDVIARYSMVDPHRKGNISCPSPKHQDKTPSAHIYKDTNTCRCFSCNTTFTPISIIMENMNLNLPQACDTLIKDFFLPIEHYSNASEIEQARKDYKAGRTSDIFPFTPQECKLIGLPYAMNNMVRNDLYEVEIYSEELDMYLKDSFGEKYMKVDNLAELWKTDKAMVKEMLFGKCQEKLDELGERIYRHRDYLEYIKEKRNDKEWNEGVKLYNAYIQYRSEGHTPKLNEKQFEIIMDMCQIRDTENEIDKLVQNRDKVREMKTRLEQNRTMVQKRELRSWGVRG